MALFQSRILRWPLGAAAAALMAPVVACSNAEPVQSAPTVTAGTVLLAAAEGDSRSDVSGIASSSYGDYLAGLIADYRKDVSAAADFMLLTLEGDPDNLRLLSKTFMLVSADGRHVEAVRLARRLVQQTPDHSAANLVLAVDAVERNDVEAAIGYLEQVPNKGLGTMIRPLIGGWLQMGQDAPDQALEELAELEETGGLSILHKMHVALMNDLAGRSEDAEAAFNEAIDPAQRPSLRMAWLAGNFFERQGKPEAARDLYDRYREGSDETTLFDPAFKRLDDGTVPAPAIADYTKGVAETLFNLASLLSQERVEQMALIHVHLALRLDPQFDVARILLGEVLQNQDRGAEAIAVYRHIGPASPFSWSARLRIAEELDRIDRTEEAIAELEALASERSDDFEAVFRLGNILRAKERFAEAVSAYDRAFERLSDAEERHWTMYYFRGIALERSGIWERAEADFLKALELKPEQPYVMNYLAYSWVEKKMNLDRAKEMLVRAVELRPNDGFIVDSLGWVYYRLQEYDLAVSYLEQAVELRPQDPVINDHLGDAYWQVGRKHEARFQWRRALSLDPEDDLIPKISTKIDEGLIAAPEKI